MNRRVVLIDTEETPDYVAYYGCGLGSEIYTIQQLSSMDPGNRDQILNFGEGDGIMLVGAEPFKYLQGRYHFGIRSENYFDCSKLRRLSIEGGAFVKVVIDFPDKTVINDFLCAEFVKPTDFSWFKQKVLHSYSESIKFLDYMDSLPDDTMFGFDYEASGMPLDKWFELSGASICTVNYGGFISFTDIRHSASEADYKNLLNRLGSFLVKRQDHIWTYNMQYEFQVSHRMLGVDLFNLCDASVVNVLDGNHLKKYSLKWTANMVLQSTVWDTEFDRISDLIDSMLFTEEGKLKKEKHKVLKVEKDNYQNTDEWKELCRRYPNYIKEFESLIEEYWGNAFMCIPSDILGYYCNLDAFYTLMIYESRKNTYSTRAFNVFLDNIRLQTRLHSCGINKDEKFRHDYEVYCKKMMAWGITYCAEARCKIKMIKHQSKMANIKKYSPVAAKLLKDSKFFGGDILEITKYILSSNIDTLDTYDTGLNEGALLLKFGESFATSFIDIVKNAMIEVKMKTKIDEGIIRKKKILGLIAEKLSPLIGLDKIKINDKHLELEKFIYYETAYNELMKVSKRQLNDVNNIPDTIRAFGQTFDLDDYSDFVSNNYFKCKSPIENDEICLEFASLYPHETSFLAALLESTLQLDNGDKFYSNAGINNINDAFKHFMDNWYVYFNSPDPVEYMKNHPELYRYLPPTRGNESGAFEKLFDGIDPNLPKKILGPYPEKIYKLAMEFFSGIKKNQLPDSVKEIWANFNGYKAQEQFFKDVSNDENIDFYNKIFEDSDLNENLKFMRKFTVHYLLYKKYSKVLTTYIGTYDKKKEKNVGMFLGDDKYVIENPNNHVMIREADPGEPGAVTKMTTKFSCMEKSSKRWSSGYHTIISHSDIKSTIASYPGCLVTYFDIKY